MVNFLDRRTLKKILDKANALRKLDGGPAEQPVSVYLARGQKRPKGKALHALQTLHAAAVDACGGRVARDLPDGLTATFRSPLEAVRAALHALHAADLASEFLDVPPCRIAIVHGPAAVVTHPFSDATGPAVVRASRLVGRADINTVVLEESLVAPLRAAIEGLADIEIGTARRGKIPALGTVSTRTLKPIGMKREREEELLAVDAQLRARPRR
ncbi:MAG: hypothetical protein HYY16_04495 [Planctomycetes bacterium]|nr:hypothetical protein [Planctomycetota bacterium]